MNTTTSQPAGCHYPGCSITFQLTAKESNHALSIVDMKMVAGSEPPRHKHRFEDETIIIRYGAITFFIGDDIISARAGDSVFIPKDTLHSFVIMTDVAGITCIMSPGGIEQFLLQTTSKWKKSGDPLSEDLLTDEQWAEIYQNAERYGVHTA